MGTTEPKALTGVTAKELRRHIDSDKELAIAVIRKAEHEIGAFQHGAMLPDITGQPGAIGRFNAFKRDQLRGLEKASRSPFFARIDTTRTEGATASAVRLLVSTARDTGGVIEGEDWEVVSWTSPITSLVLDQPYGHHAEFFRRRRVQYDVAVSAKYQEIMPLVKGVSFVLETGTASVEDESSLAELLEPVVEPKEAEPAAYEAKPTFGLSDIIILADQPQRAAMLLPFGDSVIIEGPPGSGKTSIGIMRIACLYDQQWEELQLERGKDPAFHDYKSMQVLVFNDEMVEYLKSLAQSIGVEKVWVETTRDFFQKICRSTKMLTGTQRADRPRVAALKGRIEVLEAYFKAFQRHAAADWAANEVALRDSLFKLGPDFVFLAGEIGDWTKKLASAKLTEHGLGVSINLADPLTEAIKRIREGQSPTRFCIDSAGTMPSHAVQGSTKLREDRMREGLKMSKRIIEGVIRRTTDRVAITRAMFDSPEYATLLEAAAKSGIGAKRVADGDRLWRRQYSIENPSYSEFDLAVSAWLGSKILLSASERESPWIGGRRERLTHLVVDEAQDLSPCHVAAIAAQLTHKGTMSLVGDLHQNLNPLGGLQTWDDAKVAGAKRSVFGVNYRQTRELGEFLRRLHVALYGKDAVWTASDKTMGGVPRTGVVRSWKQAAAAVSAEVKHWREQIPESTVAVLYDGKIEARRKKWLRKRLEEALSDQLTTVDLVTAESGGAALRRTDRVVIASVKQTKGLEFDAVVFIDFQPKWNKEVEEVDLRARNGLYVAASRARAGLSFCMAHLPKAFYSMEVDSYCERVDWKPEEGSEGPSGL